MAKEDIAKIETEQFVNEFVAASEGAQGAQAVAEGAQGVQAVVEGAQGAQGAQTVVEGAQGAQTVVEGVQGAEGAQGAQTVVEGVQGPQADYRDLYTKEVQRTKSWEGRLKAEAARNRELQDKIKEISEKAAQDTTISLDELIKADPEIQAFVAEMGDEFMKPFTKLLQVTANKLINDAVKPIKETVAPIKEKLTTDEENAAKKHYTTILGAHKDALELLKAGSLNMWIESLPYKQALEKQRILQEGETQEVIDLLTEYKQTLTPGGIGTQATTTVTPQPQNTAAIAAATVVKTGPVSLPKGITKAEDFEGAFKEATQNT